MMDEDGFRAFINTVAWQYAKSMPEKPHEYTVRGQSDIKEFVRAVFYIREHGERRYFEGRPYIYLDLDDEVICRELGLSQDELIRLKYVTGFARLFEGINYRKAWKTRRMIRIQRDYTEDETGSKTKPNKVKVT